MTVLNDPALPVSEAQSQERKDIASMVEASEVVGAVALFDEVEQAA